MFNDIIYFILYVLIKTITQIFNLFGQVIIFGFILYALASITRIIYARTLGSKAELYITGWLGTPIHEVSHALFCILFNHKIDDMKLLDLRSNNGVIGYVTHSYDVRSWYQQAGNFFIGVAPILVGSVIIYLITTVFSPEIKNNLFTSIDTQTINKNIVDIKDIFFTSISNMFMMFISATNIIQTLITTLLENNYFAKPSFWIFLYIAISVSSHMELSPADISHTWKGIIVIISFLLILNTGIAFLNMFNILEGFITNVSLLMNRALNKYTALLLLVSIMSFINLLASYIILTPISLIMHRKIINPFRV